MTGVPEKTLTRLLGVLDQLKVPYMVGESTASGVHGVVRMTRDIDLVARIREEHIQGLTEQLQADFYIDAGEIRSALEHGRSFNLIHFESSYKFDVFPLGADRYEQVQFSRRRVETSTLLGAEAIEFFVASPEDVIHSKLRWYKLGGAVSEQQWNDVLGVIAVQRERLDANYLREWAEYLKISDLLDRALSERHEPL